jgi:secreted PhoX family phosphatase
MTARPSAHFADIALESLSRRGLLTASLSLPLLGAVGACATGGGAEAASVGFAPVKANNDDTVTVPDGYAVDTVIAWGDRLFDSVPAAFDRVNITEADSMARFGFNNDMLALFPVPWQPTVPETAPDRMLLCSNHEYAPPEFLFGPEHTLGNLSAEKLRALLATCGIGVVQLAHRNGALAVITDAAPSPSALNRRISPFSEVVFSGPAAAHPWVRAAAEVTNRAEATRGHRPASPEGVMCGTYANCAGGFTPWGTYLSAEENFDFLYGFRPTAARPVYVPQAGAQAIDHANFVGNRFIRADRIPAGFAGLPAQYDLAQNPMGPALYGWNVEVDPYDPSWTPRKRTALGRRKGECATCALSPDGRAVVYSGDDQRDEFVYKFITEGRFNPADRLANRDLLDAGTLYAARFDADNTGVWLALTVEAANAAATAAGEPGFADLGDVVVRARHAARLLGATPMDRPEDVESPVGKDWVGTGSVFIACTENIRRASALPANPRLSAPGSAELQPNVTGHVVRMDEAGGDVAALTFAWDIFTLAGDPATADATTVPQGAETPVAASAWLGDRQTFTGDRFARPDNVTFDNRGHVWISTDGSKSVFPDCNDGVYCAPMTPGPTRPVRRFLTGPVGAEICGPLFVPGERIFLCAIQHPGEDDVTGKDFSVAFAEDGLLTPASAFPDGRKDRGSNAWPRPAVVAVRKRDGGLIGT